MFSDKQEIGDLAIFKVITLKNNFLIYMENVRPQHLLNNKVSMRVDFFFFKFHLFIFISLI